MSTKLDHILEDIDSLEITVPGIEPEYTETLKGFITDIYRHHKSRQELKAYIQNYAEVVKKVLKRAAKSQDLDYETAAKIKEIYRIMDDKYGIITNIPIVIEVTSENSIIPGGKIGELYFLLPDSTRVPIYQNEYNQSRGCEFLFR